MQRISWSLLALKIGNRLLARIKAVGSSLRLTRRWSELALNLSLRNRHAVEIVVFSYSAFLVRPEKQQLVYRGDHRFESHLLSQPLAFGYAFRLGSPPAGCRPRAS